MATTAFRTKKSAQTFENILRVATELFQEKGFEGATMRDLARESKIGLGALYYYFRTKEELVLRFYEVNSLRTIEEFKSRSSGPEPLQVTVAEFIRLKIEHLTPYKDLLKVVMKEAIDPDSPLSPFHPHSRPILTANITLFREFVEDANAAQGEEATEMARGLWIAQMAILAYWLHDRSTAHEATERAIQTLSGAIRLSTIASRIPGFGSLRRQILSLISNLFVARETSGGAPIDSLSEEWEGADTFLTGITDAMAREEASDEHLR